MELGRDSDTGGQVLLFSCTGVDCRELLKCIRCDVTHLFPILDQVKYVVELARALASMEGIHRVDLLTRQITSPEVDSTYSEPIEMLSCPSDGFDSCGAYVVRIPCGPSDKYVYASISTHLLSQASSTVI